MVRYLQLSISKESALEYPLSSSCPDIYEVVQCFPISREILAPEVEIFSKHLFDLSYEIFLCRITCRLAMQAGCQCI